MGFFTRLKQKQADLERTSNMVNYLSQFTYLPDISKCEGAGDWALYRGKTGETTWYVREDVKPLYVEERVAGGPNGQQAMILSYYTDKKGNSDYHYAIARGTNDELEVWFNVGVDFGSEFTAISKCGAALFFDDGSEKLHIIEPDGNHRTMQLGDYSDYAGNDHGFFWWNGEDQIVQIKGYSFNTEQALNKKIKAPSKDMYIDDVELSDAGICATFSNDEDESITKTIVCDFSGDIKEKTSN